ncbi:MAG: hypothetical protein N839_0005335 [Desulfofustis sp. PB-SRB1]|jgi:hypothetical protein|nr:hypothetical protein [Desulfofustis sp. PB-SRB1]MBM1001818.1 hypothetical protein [Desulfofustis sp. PB-SRB1]HBH28317.1 hypothetical protein [Desulfofustis sp.]HBH32015.1 hypothetical protein [Desulfofustis sp.]
MAGDHRETANHNIEILQSAGFRKQGNTSIFSNGKTKLLSPAVSCGQGGHYWFDIRQVNLDKVEGYNPHILVRIIPDMFLLVGLNGFAIMLSEETKRYRKNSGAVWGFYTSLSISSRRAKIASTANSSLVYETQILKREEILKALNQFD